MGETPWKFDSSRPHQFVTLYFPEDKPPMSEDRLREAALEYHRHAPPGKIAILPTKPLNNQHDLSLAYSPGVAAACEAIVADPVSAALYTSRGNLVAVISNGTAVLIAAGRA